MIFNFYPPSNLSNYFFALAGLLMGLLTSWRFFGSLLRFLYNLENKLSIKVREETDSKYLELNKTIITVSSGAIVLIPALLGSQKSFKELIYALVVAIVCYGLTIILGIIGQYIVYLRSRIEKILIINFEKGSQRANNEIAEGVKQLKLFSRRSTEIAFLQLYFFVAAFVFLSLFIIVNLVINYY